MDRLAAGTLREATIDPGAITANVRHLRQLSGAELIAVVKADGYGHGAVLAARAALAGGASRIGVADLREALHLRNAGIDAPILAWLHAPGQSFAEAAAQGVEIGVSTGPQLHQIAVDASADRPIAVHLKLETGLGRNGIPPEEYSAIFAETARLQNAGKVKLIGIFSHLSNASDEDDLAALAIFQDALGTASRHGLAPEIVHIAATHAAIALPAARLGCVRVGVGIYGLSPFTDRSSAELGLRPAMSLRAPVAAVRRVGPRHGVSYGYDYRAGRETTLALVPLGYADGIPRQASGKGTVSIGGKRFSVAGRVAMDQFVVDVGDYPVTLGEEVVVFGDPEKGQPAADEWALAAGTINYDIVTRIGARVPRRSAEQ